MRNLSSSRKAQFFILTAFTIVSIVYFIGKWVEPYTITDTSAVVLREEPFLFDNIKEKAIATVKGSNDCEELRFNLQEYKKFVNNYVLEKNMDLSFEYSIIQPCNDLALETSFDIVLTSASVQLRSTFTTSRI